MPTDEPTTEIKSRFPINPPSISNPRISMFLWGEPGSGKTVFASTAPGKRLWIQFDPDGTQSINKHETDDLVIDLSQYPLTVVEEAKSNVDPFGIGTLLKENEDIKTVIIDSVTAFTEKATAHSVGRAPGATFENPSQSGYGHRNRFTLAMVSNTLFVTGKYGRHIIFIGHESPPELNKEGLVVSITIQLGGSLASTVPMQISEVWNYRDTGTKRLVAVRKVGTRKPMKSRMFDSTKKYEFESTYDRTTRTGLKISDIYDKWKDNKFQPIAVP